MLFESIHHIAIIGRNYNKTKEFYVKKLGFKIISEYHRVDKNDIIINVKKENVVLEIFINQESSKGMVDISDSRGYSFFKDIEINICHENIRYSEE